MFPQVDWTVETLEPRHFKWRYRGNALTWGTGEFPDDDFDLLVATSTTNLAPLLGLRPKLHAAHKVVYFHENQFIYPTQKGRGIDANFAVQEVLTASAADLCVFNSAFNRDTFLDEARRFFGRLPDGVPGSVFDEIEARSRVIPVPIVAPEIARRDGRENDSPLQIVWNHRWEHDKGPALLRDAIGALLERTNDFVLHVVGQQFREEPPEFGELEELARAQLGRWGWVESKSDYHALLASCDVVLSTSHHEFQGLSVLEAMMCDCRALVPDALAYREYVPAPDRYAYGEDSAKRIADRLHEWSKQVRKDWRRPSYDLSRFEIARLRPRYADAFGLGCVQA